MDSTRNFALSRSHSIRVSPRTHYHSSDNDNNTIDKWKSRARIPGVPLKLKADVSRELTFAELNFDPEFSDDLPGLTRILDNIYEDAIQLFESSPNIDVLFGSRVAHKLSQRYGQSKLRFDFNYRCEPQEEFRIGTKHSGFSLIALSSGRLRLQLPHFKKFPLIHDDHRNFSPPPTAKVNLEFETQDFATLPNNQKYLVDLAAESRFLLRHVDRFMHMFWTDMKIKSPEQLANRCAEAIFKHLKPLTAELKLCGVYVRVYGKGLPPDGCVNAEVGDYSDFRPRHPNITSSNSSARTSPGVIADSQEHNLQPKTATATKHAAPYSESLLARDDTSDLFSKNIPDADPGNADVVLDVLRRTVDLYHFKLETLGAKMPRAVDAMHQRHAVPEAQEEEAITGDAATRSLPNVAFIAMGSNIGERFKTIQKAFNAIAAEPSIRIVNSSFLYETEPMYVQDQARFINGVVVIVTSLPPLDLLDRLQEIERRLGRVKTIDKGPRTVDLDILAYNNDKINHPRLTVPHARMHEREFVLRPLRDTLLNASCNEDLGNILAELQQQNKPMHTCLPLAPYVPPVCSTDPTRPAHIMTILNMTPDSFSDGGLHQPSDMEHLKSKIMESITAGATIVDVGGQSSRPHAPDVTAEEELSRILPAIEAIKSMPEACEVVISVDTYRAKVAKAAVEAGAHIVNDISAGLLDPDMLSTVAELGCTYVAMHMRGTPATMTSAENCSYPYGVIDSIRFELDQRVQAALAAGIPRWRIILDPGIGFAKTQAQNLKILEKLWMLRATRAFRGFPWLIGSSRKGFIGHITGVAEARERVWGTAATVTAAIQGGADIVRVHDVDEMAKVAKMACAIYRPPLRRSESMDLEND